MFMLELLQANEAISNFLIFDIWFFFLQGCVMDALEGKTVILVTHQVEFLPAVDTILVTTF